MPAAACRLATIAKHLTRHNTAGAGESIGTPATEPLALRGVRVIELGTVVAAPAASAQMADHGANVIKVEIPTGDTNASRYLQCCPPPRLYLRFSSHLPCLPKTHTSARTRTQATCSVHLGVATDHPATPSGVVRSNNSTEGSDR